MKQGWKSAAVDEICNVEYGKRVVRKNDAGTKYAVYGGGGETFRVDDHNREDRVVVARFGLSEQCTRRVGGRFFLNDSGLTLSPREPSELLPEFLDLWTLASNDLIYGLSRGTAQRNLDVDAFRQLRVRYPSDVSEQRRIVAILDEAFEGIAAAKANAEKNLLNADEILESRLQSLLSPDQAECNHYTLDEIASVFGRGKSRHRPRNEPTLYGGPYPFIQTGDIRSADHVVTTFTQTYSDKGLAQSKLWPRGTVCITIAANIAESAILGFDACFPDSVVGVIPNPQKASAEFLEFLLQAFKRKLQAMGKGSAQDNINVGTFENQQFPFPSVEEQRKEVAILSSVLSYSRLVADCVNKKIEALDELKASLLQQAFTGQL